MELTERLELSTSPLPRECSTTELRQRISINLTRLSKSYRERIRPRRTRKAKNPNKIRESERYLPASIVNQAALARTPMVASATSMRPVPAGWKSKTFTSLQLQSAELTSISELIQQIRGAQGRIRTSVTRRVADLQSAAINRSATCAHPANRFQLGPLLPSSFTRVPAPATRATSILLME